MIPNKLLGREIFKRPTCPFCGLPIERPKELTTRMPGEMPVGACSCGAVYACDETGHNLGSAMIEALMFGCDLDPDLAWGLLPEEDYRDEIVEHYDYVNHLIVPGGALESRRISGALFFIKLHEDVLEVTAEGVKQRLEKADHVSPKPQVKPNREKPLTKKEVELLVREFRFDQIVSVAGGDKRLISKLQRLLYSGDDLFRKRAAETLGRVSAVISESDPGAISKLLQRLFTAIQDTAAFTWGAFEAIGEIIRFRPDLFAGYIPQLYNYLSDGTLRAQVVEVIGRIARSRPDLFRKSTFHFIPFLSDPDPLVRGYTAWVLGNIGAYEWKEDLERLVEDSHEMNIYENGMLEEKTVGQLASEAIEKINELK